MNFESEIKKGSFMISECNDCKKIVWPSSEFCNHCFKETIWRKSTGMGKILEFSKKGDVYFCLIEMENSIKFVGELIIGIPKIGDSVSIAECGMIDNGIYIKIKIL